MMMSMQRGRKRVIEADVVVCMWMLRSVVNGVFPCFVCLFVEFDYLDVKNAYLFELKIQCEDLSMCACLWYMETIRATRVLSSALLLYNRC